MGRNGGKKRRAATASYKKEYRRIKKEEHQKNQNVGVFARYILPKISAVEPSSNVGLQRDVSEQKRTYVDISMELEHTASANMKANKKQKKELSEKKSSEESHSQLSRKYNTEIESMTYTQLEKLENDIAFSSVSHQLKDVIYNECRDLLTGDFMNRSVCAVCDELVRTQDSALRDITDDFVARCANRLKPWSDIPQSLQDQYDVSEMIPSLKNVLVSKRAEYAKNDDSFKMRVCKSCYGSLMKGKCSEERYPPKLSVANGFAIGTLPSYLANSTVTEHRLTSLASHKAQIVIARGGKHRIIKSHVLVFSSQPELIKAGLDRILNDENKILLIFTNPMTPAQKRVTMKRYEACRSRVNGLLKFYAENNHLYKRICTESSDIDLMQSLSSASQKDLDNITIVHNIDDPSIAQNISSDQSNIRRPDVLDEASNAEQELTVQRDASLFTSPEPVQPDVALRMASEKVVDVQQSGKFMPDTASHLFAKLFPHLFPYGEGDPGAERPIKVSMHECVKHYLRLSTRAFAQDETFPLIAFDIVSRKRAMLQTALTCRLNPHEIEHLGEVTCHDLSAQLKKEADRRDAIRKGHELPKQEHKTSAKRILQRVQATLGKSFATNEERRTYQRKAWNLAAKYNGCALFLTVTPNENGNATIAAYAGELSERNLANIKHNDVPSNAMRMEIAGKDPVACDIFFTNILEILTGPILGFDLKTKLPRKNGGLFGVVKAFVGGIETQGKGTLHVHLVAFLAGFPRTIESMVNKALKNDEFQERLLSFFDSSVFATTAVDCEKMQCPKCTSYCTISAIDISKEAYKLQLGKVRPPPTSQCSFCGTKYGDSELIRARITSMKEDLIAKGFAHLITPMFDSDKECNNATAMRAAVPAVPALPDMNSSEAEHIAHEIYKLEVLLLCQEHKWKHVPSCFKSSSNACKGECRYVFPRKPSIATDMDQDGKLTLQRHVGNEYINNYNPVLLQLFRCNHDVRFLINSAEETYYALKYSMKDQHPIDNITAFTVAAFANRLSKEEGKDLTNWQKVYGRISALAYARTEMLEVGAVLAVHYLLHESTFVCSHDFQTLHLGKHLQRLDNQESSVALVKDGLNYVPYDSTMDYRCRPTELESVSLYEYTESYYLARAPQGNNEAANFSENENERPSHQKSPQQCNSEKSYFELTSNHPLHGKKVVRRRNIKRVPDMIGPRFPDLYQVSEEKRELYSKMALLLFKPHRNSNDVLLENCSYTASFDAFRTTEYYTNSEADHILTNIQQYYTGKRRAKELRELENSHKDEESFLFSDSDDETDDGRDDQEETEQLNFEMNDAAFESNVTEFANQNLASRCKDYSELDKRCHQKAAYSLFRT